MPDSWVPTPTDVMHALQYQYQPSVQQSMQEELDDDLEDETEIKDEWDPGWIDEVDALDTLEEENWQDEDESEDYLDDIDVGYLPSSPTHIPHKKAHLYE
ncbi:hypothetical protein EDC04DRAFT_2893937 [Pisolithus marmoratus]|nr:hypothetical protein EDC04DRAFT_2893937 [Pisolithus marmoratus]